MIRAFSDSIQRAKTAMLFLGVVIGAVLTVALYRLFGFAK